MSGARKDDAQKLRYDLIPILPLEELARVFTIGAAKYSERNWEQGFDYSRVYAALLRHLTKWWDGESHDEEDGQLHLSSVIWCAMVLLEFELRGTGTDDRPK